MAIIPRSLRNSLPAPANLSAKAGGLRRRKRSARLNDAARCRIASSKAVGLSPVRVLREHIPRFYESGSIPLNPAQARSHVKPLIVHHENVLIGCHVPFDWLAKVVE
jgi:hypothetical protein